MYNNPWALEYCDTPRIYTWYMQIIPIVQIGYFVTLDHYIHDPASNVKIYKLQA